MAIEINWGLLQPVDIGGEFQKGMQRGQQWARERAVEGALRDLTAGGIEGGGDPVARHRAEGVLAAYAPDRLQAIDTLRTNRLKTEQEVAALTARRAALGAYGTDPVKARQLAMTGADAETLKIIDQLDESSQKQLVAAGRLLEAQNPTDDASWQQTLELARRGGINVANAPQTFDPQYVAGIKHLANAIAPAKESTAPSDVREYEYAKAQGFTGTFMDYKQQMGNPFVVENPDGTKTIIPRSSLMAGGGGGGAPAAPAGAPAAPGQVGSVLSTELPAPVVAGFLGNFHIEGGYTGAEGDGGKSGGAAQWNGPRRENFKRIIGVDPTQATPEQTGKFVLWEMKNPEAAGMTVAQRDAILSAKTPAEAAALIDKYYERSSGAHTQKRVAAAEAHGGTQKVSSKAEFDRLASGTRFIAPDGTVRIKP
jgi:hypothetical protein